MVQKSCVCRPEISPKYFDKLKPEPARNPARTHPDPKSPARLTTLLHTKPDHRHFCF